MEPEPLPQCDCRKALYESKKHAETVRNARLNGVFVPEGQGGRRIRQGRPKALRIYACPDGAGWHITAKLTWRNNWDDA